MVPLLKLLKIQEAYALGSKDKVEIFVGQFDCPTIRDLPERCVARRY
jgi:hypothetical protein